MILHDLDREIRREDTFVFSAKAAPCVGCFDCWLQTPGKCVLKDRGVALAPGLRGCKKLIVISKNVYGGFSPRIKRALDRCIPALLPFFRTVEGEMHHQTRYVALNDLYVYFYNAGEMSEQEKRVAGEIVRANGINLNAGRVNTVFLNDADRVKELIK